MADSRANIDLIFRNGLKDYEVYPPLEVWTNIQPAIGKKKKHISFLRYAASIAFLVSTGVFAYWWGYETSRERFFADVIINNESVTPLDIAVPPAIIPDRTEPTVIMAVANVNKQEFETVNVPVVAQLDIPEITYIEDYYVEESIELVAELESFPETQELININNAIAFLPEYQPIFYYENIAEDEDNRWSILAMASPMYQSQFTTSNNDLSRQIMNSDQSRASYSGGVSFAYKINRKFSIQSGLYYSAMGQELSDVVAYNGFSQVNPSKGANNFKVLTSNGTVNASNPDIYLGSYNVPDRVITQYGANNFDPNKGGLNYLSNSIFTDLRYIELPLILRFKAIDRKMGVSLVGGVWYNFLVSNSVFGGKTDIGKMEGLSDLSFSSSLGLGMEYKFSKNISFNVEPTFRYFLNSSNSGRIPGLHNYAIGVFSGMSYKF